MDLWHKVLPVYKSLPAVDPSLCACLLDTDSNGIHTAVQWVANHYESGTPITLLNRAIPKLKDAGSWAIWKDRLLHYYDTTSLHDSAMYLKCALQKFD
jgi:hypothetical protein